MRAADHRFDYKHGAFFVLSEDWVTTLHRFQTSVWMCLGTALTQNGCGLSAYFRELLVSLGGALNVLCAHQYNARWW